MTRADGIRDLQGLLDRCKLDEETGCMVWAGARHHGSGAVWWPGVGVVSLSRAFCLAHTGRKPAKGKVWWPTCGNVLCCTPAHRKLGTRAEHMKALRPSITPLHRARITQSRRKDSIVSDQDVAEIRGSNLTLAEIMERYGVCKSYASSLRTGYKRKPLAAQGSSVFAWRGGA